MDMSTSRIMLIVLAALVPGVAAMVSVWGFGVLWNLAWMSGFALIAEAVFLLAAGTRSLRDISFHLKDLSALLTGWLIAICLPPYVAPGILALAALAALGLGKHVYGGLGQNVFNPAMVGYAVVMVSFPEALAHWPAPAGVDGFSGATLLSEFRYREGLTVAEFVAAHPKAGADQRVVAFCFLAGGLVLLYLRLAAWRVPAAVMGGVALAALFGYDQGSSTSLGSTFFHWTTGGTVAAAFFIATDPVSHPRTPRNQILYGLMIGVLIYLIRAYGSFPDGIAFAVLFANAFVPLMNRYEAPLVARRAS